MLVMNATDVKEQRVEKVDYRGKPADVIGVGIRWLSKVTSADGPEYGLRLFTLAPGAVIPIHKHLYHQTMYIVTGRVECMAFDPETDALVETKVCGPGQFAYSPSMEPHGARNASETEPATFLCAIANVYKDAAAS